MNTSSAIFEENMEKYKDPEMYDLQYETYLKDLPMLLEWSRKMDGPIVDLACGTGRITIPIAEEGIKIIGIDLNKGMLDRAKQKSEKKRLNITWLHQDCSNFSLDFKSPLMYMTGNSFQHFLTNESQDKLLRSIYNHLDTDGIFIFGTRFPISTELITTQTPETIYYDKLNRKVSEYFIEKYDSLEQILYSTSVRKVYGQDNEIVSEETDRISLRYVFPKEMDRLLEQNGYRVIEKYGSWDKEKLTVESSEMIYVCQRI
jgi:SAM-dependent methyltransferase